MLATCQVRDVRPVRFVETRHCRRRDKRVKGNGGEAPGQSTASTV